MRFVWYSGDGGICSSVTDNAGGRAGRQAFEIKKHLFLLLRTMRKSGTMSVLYSVKIMPYMRRQTVKRGVMWQ